jgi:multidrug efflux pump subunit AcrB
MLASFLLSRTLVPTMAKYMMRSHHEAPKQHDEDGYGDKGVRPSQGDENNPVHEGHHRDARRVHPVSPVYGEGLP